MYAGMCMRKIWLWIWASVALRFGCASIRMGRNEAHSRRSALWIWIWIWM